MKASIRELRISTKRLIRAVDRGETVILTYRGEDCAKIIPIRKTAASAKHSVFGMWKDHKETRAVKKYLDKLRSLRDVS